MEEIPYSNVTPRLSTQIKSVDFDQFQLKRENKLSLQLKYTAIMYSLSYQSRKKVKMKLPNETLCPSNLTCRYGSDLSFKWGEETSPAEKG